MRLRFVLALLLEALARSRGDGPQPFKVPEEVLKRLQADERDPEALRQLQGSPEVLKHMQEQQFGGEEHGDFKVPEGASTELTPELEELLQEQDPDLLKMLKEGRSPHDDVQREPPVPEDGSLTEEQVPHMLARALDQVLSDDFDQEASKVLNVSSPDALAACLPQDLRSSFVGQLATGIEHLLKQKPSSARKGLLSIARGIEAAAQAAKASCGQEAKGATQLRDLARRLAEGVKAKGSIEYSRLKVFKVGHVDVRQRLNAFVFVWKMCKDDQDARALGKAAAELLMYHAAKASQAPPDDDADEL